MPPQTFRKSCDSLEIQALEDMASTSVEAGLDKTSMSCYERWLISTTFFFLGLGSLFAWNNVLYVLPYVTEQFLHGWDAGNSLLGVFQVGNFSIQVLLLLVGTMYEVWLHVGMFLGAILCAALGPCLTHGSLGSRIAMLHVLCLLLGAGSGFLQGSGFCIAAIMPVDQVGMLSTGQGFGAIFSVLLIGVLSFTALDINVRDDVATLIYITSGITVVVGAVCMIFIAATLRQPAAKAALAGARADSSTAEITGLSKVPPELHDVVTTTSAAEEGRNKKQTLWKVLRLAGVPVACIFVLFFVTCNLFPRVGPSQWHTVNPPKNHLVWLFGIFPFGDTLGRCLCVFAGKGFFIKKIILFPPRLLPWISFLRAGLYVPFFLSKHLADNVVLSAFWFQVLEMIAISVSHGWLATVAFMYSFNAVQDVRDKRRVGPLGTLSLLFGIMSGLYFALLYR